MLKNCLLGIFFFTVSLTMTIKVNAASPGGAAFASIIPGLGQTIDGRPGEGIAWFLTIGGLLAFSSSVNLSVSYWGKKTPLLSHAAFDLWLYNVYDAYRDAKPTDHLYSDQNALANYIATFNPLNAFDAVGTPFLLGYTAISGVGTAARNAGKPLRYPFFAFTGMGEEGLFRGFLFPAISTLVHSKIAGAIISSVLFSAAHIVNGQENFRKGAIPRVLMGLVFAWETHRNKYDLRHTIFTHSWLDILVAKESIELPDGKDNDWNGTIYGVKWNLAF